MPGAALSLPEGYRLKVFSTLDSTNSEALRLAADGEPSGLWIWAESQQAGRGRSGRTWDSLPGNLFCSLLLRPACAPSSAPQLGFVAGVALHRSIADLQSHDASIDTRLKWPNDILLNGKKAGGILLESQLPPDGQITVIIGIGLNIASHPDTAAYPATSLALQGIKTSHGAMLEKLSQQFDIWIRLWDNGSGFPAIKKAWIKCAHDIGSPLAVKLPGGLLEGRFDGLDEHGSLIVTMKDGRKKHVTAGDVFPL